jgi:hypothetical protein
MWTSLSVQALQSRIDGLPRPLKCGGYLGHFLSITSRSFFVGLSCNDGATFIDRHLENCSEARIG